VDQDHLSPPVFSPRFFPVSSLLGAIVATQVLASSYRFHPALRFNLFHVYPPWSYFVWSHQWEQPSNYTPFAQAFGIGSLVTLGGFFLLLLDVARANFRVNPFFHGSARWADRRDVSAKPTGQSRSGPRAFQSRPKRVAGENSRKGNLRTVDTASSS
jgi:type IV secretion system protein VirD4